MTRDHETLGAVGQALFGTTWQSDLARALGVSDRTVRRWAAGDYDVPDGVWNDLVEICRKHGRELEEWAVRLDQRL